MRGFVMFIALIALLPPLAASSGDVACQYDCLAKGGLPEVCDSKCGISRKQQQRSDDGVRSTKNDKGGDARGGNRYYDAYGMGEANEPSEGDGSSASGGGRVYFACIKDCRDAGNKLQDCRALCNED